MCIRIWITDIIWKKRSKDFDEWRVTHTLCLIDEGNWHPQVTYQMHATVYQSSGSQRVLLVLNTSHIRSTAITSLVRHTKGL